MLLHALSLIGAVVLVSAVAVQAQSTPTETYKAYRAALAKASSYDDILPFMEPKGRAMVEAMPVERRAAMFGLMKKFAGTFTDVAVYGETVTGDTAVLEVFGKDPKGQPATGTVPMSRHDGAWKVGTENWSSKPR